MKKSMPSEVRTLLAVRVVVVTSLLFAALIIQFTADIVLPISYVYLVTGLTYVLTLIYIALGRAITSRNLNIYVQVGGDLLLETLIVYFTGGADSPFSFLYLVSIITASMLLYRRGGVVTASASAILYGSLVDVMYYGIVPMPPRTVFSPPSWTLVGIYLNMATNFAGFYATALLTSYLSEKLRRTAQELDANRQNLAELRALNENVIESIPSGVLTITPDGMISFANPAACQILGRNPLEIVGLHAMEIGVFDEKSWHELSETVERTGIARGERTREDPEGEFRCVGYALTPLSSLEGSPYGMTLIFQDLTEMKQLEAQVRMKDRMAAVGELSAGIAHEIRNPLAAISGSVQALQSSERLTPSEERLMSIILKESDRLNRSIADFLQFVKPKERSLSEFDIAASLSETLELFANSPELEESHRIVPIIDPPTFPIVGDANQIRQVFWNVAKNAIQAMPGGGMLRVLTQVDDRYYNIVFSDSGRGMSEEDQRRIFQPFRTNLPSGTGLGMAISYRIIQEHDGRIAVNSQQGRGTTITISLPIEARSWGASTRKAETGSED